MENEGLRVILLRRSDGVSGVEGDEYMFREVGFLSFGFGDSSTWYLDGMGVNGLLQPPIFIVVDMMSG